jgi:hypothetical protein
MINPATDCTTPGPDDWRRMSRRSIERFATAGNADQRASLLTWVLDWGYSNLTFYVFEEYYELVTGEPWQQD